jgi:hypothetical protein
LLPKKRNTGSVNNSNSDSEMTNSDVNNASSSCNSSSSSSNSTINRNNNNDIVNDNINNGNLCEGFFDRKYMEFSGGNVVNIAKMMVIGNSMEINIAPNKNVILRKDSNDLFSFFSLNCMIDSNNHNIHSSSGNRKCCNQCKSERRKSYWNRNIKKIDNNDNKSILDMTSKDVEIMNRTKLNKNFITLGDDHAYEIFLKELKTNNDKNNDDDDNKSDNSDDSSFIPDNESDDNIDLNNDKPNDMLCEENNENEKSIMKKTIDDKEDKSLVNKR